MTEHRVESVSWANGYAKCSANWIARREQGFSYWSQSPVPYRIGGRKTQLCLLSPCKEGTLPLFRTTLVPGWRLAVCDFHQCLHLHDWEKCLWDVWCHIEGNDGTGSLSLLVDTQAQPKKRYLVCLPQFERKPSIMKWAAGYLLWQCRSFTRCMH